MTYRVPLPHYQSLKLIQFQIKQSIILTSPQHSNRFLYRISNLVLNTISAKVWNLTVGEVLEATACKFPEKTMIIFTGEGAAATKRMTFREVNEHTNQVAHFFEARSYGKGDVMALCAENRHDYMSLWLGMSKLGSVTALINTYITDTSLVHTLDTVKAKGVMFTSETEKSRSCHVAQEWD